MDRLEYLMLALFALLSLLIITFGGLSWLETVKIKESKDIKIVQRYEPTFLQAKSFYNINEAVEFYESLPSPQMDKAQIINCANDSLFIVYY